MEIRISENIQTVLSKKRSMTQEQLAEALAVTVGPFQNGNWDYVHPIFA